LQLEEYLEISGRYVQLNRNCPFHGYKYTLLKNFLSTQKERRFLPALKDWVSAPSIR
jgi:hypothetical protein